MSTSDTIHRFLFEKTDIRGEVVSLNTSFTDATSHQKLPSVLKQLLGEFFAGAILLAETLKFEGLLTLQVRGNGPVSLIVAETDHNGNIRGILRRNQDNSTEQDLDFTNLDFKETIGKAVLTITIDPDKGKRYQGAVPLDGNSLSEAIENYFEQSEQLATRIWLFSSEDKCSGLMLQSLPPQEITDMEKRGNMWQTAVHLCSTITEKETYELNHDELLYRLFNELNCVIFPPKHINFHCSCTRERSANALTSLGKQDAYDLLSERDIINIDCEFCGKEYVFSEKDLENIFGPQEKPLH